MMIGSPGGIQLSDGEMDTWASKEKEVNSWWSIMYHKADLLNMHRTVFLAGKASCWLRKVTKASRNVGTCFED